MLTFDLFTIVLQLSLLAAANAASQAKATVYSCSSTDLVAYTQFGVFKKVLASSNCSLLLPNSLSRSANDKVNIFIGHISTPPGSTCETEYLEISGRKFCGGTLRGAVTLTLSEDVLISFQTTSPDSRITFNLRYTVYTDVCGAPSTISQWPAILQTNISQPTPCSTQLNVTHYDKIEILMKDSIGRFSCNFNGVSVRTSNGSVLCQGINCLNSAGYDITNYTTLTVKRTSCVFSWYIQAFSESIVQDICSLSESSLTLPQGQISSPGYRQGYTGTVDCSVYIKGFEAVSITIMHYKLKKKLCSDENICNCGDRLVINGTAKCGSYTKPANRTYIGADIPVTVSLVTNSLKLGSGAGFYLTYQGYSGAVDICSLLNNQELSVPILIKSPNFPNHYANNMNCQAKINFSKAVSVRIQIITMSMEDYGFNQQCIYDYLSIGDVRYCGRKDGYIIEQEVKTILLSFKSDRNKTSSGFYLSIEHVQPPQQPNIDRILTNITEVLALTGSTTIPTVLHTTTLIVPEPHTSSFTKAFPKLIDSKVFQEKEEEIIDYKKNSDLIVTANKSIHHTETLSNYSLHDNAGSTTANQCPVPWYFWICSLIAVLVAVTITITVFLIKLKKLKVAISSQSYSDTESSRDGLTNPVYYSHSHHNHRNGTVPYNGTLPSHGTIPPHGESIYYTSNEFPPWGSRIVNKNSAQTTV